MDFFTNNHSSNENSNDAGKSQNQTITIEIIKIKNRIHTCVRNFIYTMDSEVETEKDMLKKFKKEICNTGGFFKEGDYVLQGNCVQKVEAYLKSIGITSFQLVGAT